MTREEAIKYLDCARDILPNKAIDMAIEALEQEPTCRNFRQIDLKRGEWVDRASELNADFRRHDFVCSECAHAANYFVGGSEDWWDMEKPKYCPNCGTRMESDRE